MDQIATGLADAGGWAVVVAMMTAIGLGSVRKWWVPGFVYDREAKRADEATTQLERHTEAIRGLTDVLRNPPRLPGGSA